MRLADGTSYWESRCVMVEELSDQMNTNSDSEELPMIQLRSLWVGQIEEGADAKIEGATKNLTLLNNLRVISMRKSHSRPALSL